MPWPKSQTFIVLLLVLLLKAQPLLTSTAVNSTQFDDKNKSMPTEKKKCSITLPEFIVYFYCQPVICLFGFILNVINVFVFRSAQFMGAAYAYMIAMSVADAITLLANMPSGLLRCSGYFPYCQHWLFKRFREGMLYYNAYVLFPLGNISETASVWFTVLLSVERYTAMRKIGISYQNRSSSDVQHSKMGSLVKAMKRWFSDHWTRLPDDYFRVKWCHDMNYKHSIIAVTVLSIFFNFPLFFVQRVEKKYRNVTAQDTDPILYTKLTKFGESTFYKTSTWLRIFFVQGLPLVLLCIGNFCLFHFIQMASHRRQQVLQQPNNNSNKKNVSLFTDGREGTGQVSSHSCRWQVAQRKLTILLIVIVALFLAGQIPQAFSYVTIFRAFGNTCPRPSCCYAYLIYRGVTSTLCLFTYAVNFFVYFALNKHFKHQICKWLHIVRSCKVCYRGVENGGENRGYKYPVEKAPATFAGELHVSVSPRKLYTLKLREYSSEIASAPVIMEPYFQPQRSAIRRLFHSGSPKPVKAQVDYTWELSTSSLHPTIGAKSPVFSIATSNSESGSHVTEQNGQFARAACWKSNPEFQYTHSPDFVAPNNARHHFLDTQYLHHTQCSEVSNLMQPHSARSHSHRSGWGSVGDPTECYSRSHTSQSEKPCGTRMHWLHCVGDKPQVPPPFPYQENDFDVISIDESVGIEPKTVQTSV